MSHKQLASLLVEGADVFRTKAGREFNDMKQSIFLIKMDASF